MMSSSGGVRRDAGIIQKAGNMPASGGIRIAASK